MCLISIFLASGCIFHTYEGNSVCLPRCLLSHTIISAYKCFISDFHVCVLLSTLQRQYMSVNSNPVNIPMALWPNAGNGLSTLEVSRLCTTTHHSW